MILVICGIIPIQDDSDSTLLYDYQPEGRIAETTTISTCAMEDELKMDENQSKAYSANKTKEDRNKPQMDSINNQNMKTAKVLLHKLTKQEIMDLTKNKKNKIGQKEKEN